MKRILFSAILCGFLCLVFASEECKIQDEIVTEIEEKQEEICSIKTRKVCRETPKNCRDFYHCRFVYKRFCSWKVEWRLYGSYYRPIFYKFYYPYCTVLPQKECKKKGCNAEQECEQIPYQNCQTVAVTQWSAEIWFCCKFRI